MTARSKSFDEPAPEMGNYRTEALQTGAAGAFDIDAFRRQMGFVPPPRPAALPQTQAPRAPAALIDDSSSDDDSSIDSDTSSIHTLSTRTLSGGNPRYDPIAPAEEARVLPETLEQDSRSGLAIAEDADHRRIVRWTATRYRH